jgi:hypothetical protein
MTVIRIKLLNLYVQLQKMDVKLTLKLQQEVIERAKVFAKNKEMSLSKLVENYLRSLVSPSDSTNEIALTPFVKSLQTGVKLPLDLDYKEVLGNKQEKKHQ